MPLGDMVRIKPGDSNAYNGWVLVIQRLAGGKSVRNFFLVNAQKGDVKLEQEFPRQPVLEIGAGGDYQRVAEVLTKDPVWDAVNSMHAKVLRAVKIWRKGGAIGSDLQMQLKALAYQIRDLMATEHRSKVLEGTYNTYVDLAEQIARDQATDSLEIKKLGRLLSVIRQIALNTAQGQNELEIKSVGAFVVAAGPTLIYEITSVPTMMSTIVVAPTKIPTMHPTANPTRPTAATVTPTPTRTRAGPPTVIPTVTPTATPTATRTQTETPTPTATPTAASRCPDYGLVMKPINEDRALEFKWQSVQRTEIFKLRVWRIKRDPQGNPIMQNGRHVKGELIFDRLDGVMNY